jgi:hypothetical protein
MTFNTGHEKNVAKGSVSQWVTERRISASNSRVGSRPVSRSGSQSNLNTRPKTPKTPNQNNSRVASRPVSKSGSQSNLDSRPKTPKSPHQNNTNSNINRRILPQGSAGARLIADSLGLDQIIPSTAIGRLTGATNNAERKDAMQVIGMV